MIFTNNKVSSSNSGYWDYWKMQKKYVTEKYTRAHAPLARKYTNRIFESGTIVSLTIWRRDFLTKLQSYRITDF